MSIQEQQGRSILEAIRTPRRGLRVFATTICVLMVNALMAPQIFAIGEQQRLERQAKAIVLRGTNEQKLNQGLLKVQEIAARKQARLAERVQNESGVLDSVLSFVGLSQLRLEDVEQMRELAELLENEHQQAVINFGETRNSLESKGVAPVILQRHDQMVEQYINRYADMTANLHALLNAESLVDQQQAADALHQFMKGQKLKKSHQFTDPNNLPWGTPDAKKTRKPAETAEELQQLTGISPLPQGVQLATNVITPDMLGNPGGPVAEDLEETPDVKLTEAIRAKAEELNHDPVEIYNWVRNTIEFIPSYGSIQGADYTLQTGKGNAFDTASLLIALYRASNIPARYAYGTIDVPADQVMNWVGGVEVPEAAQQLLGQGGIPNVAMVSGGKISHIRMEHVWVEAWIDYLPSRGAKHQVGDSWIPLDASFKQYEFSEERDLSVEIPPNVGSLADQIEGGIVKDEGEGWIQHVDRVGLEAAVSTYQQQITDYIDAQNPSTKLGEIMATHKLIKQEFGQLAAGLPYQVLARSENYSEIPSRLRHKFRYNLSTQSYGTESARLIAYEKSLPELAGVRLEVTFSPATPDDENLIRSHVPPLDPVSGQPDLASASSALPGYLINFSVEMLEDREIIQQEGAGTMGAELYETIGLWSPSQGWQQAVNHPVVGEYRSIGLSLQGISATEAETMRTSIADTEAAIMGQMGVSRSGSVGNILRANILSYLAINEAMDTIQSRAAGIVSYSLPSFGLFSTSLQTSYWFGIPRDVAFSGMVMDVDHLATQSVSKTNNNDATIEFIKSSGVRASILENLVPEQILSTEDAPVEGISAVKAIAIATSEGQKIWRIDRENVDLALNSISLGSEIETEIRNAVRAGKVATTHETPVRFSGGDNVGYIVIDPLTGAGAYKIASGLSGGFIDFGSIIDFIASVLKELSSDLAKYYGKLIGKLKQVFDFGDTAADCGLQFAFAKFFSVLLFTVGMTFLLMPYFAILGLFAAGLLVAILRILVIEIIISGFFSSQFNCNRP